MQRVKPAACADACVETLHAAVERAESLEETIKWGRLPVLLVPRGSPARVLFGF